MVSDSGVATLLSPLFKGKDTKKKAHCHQLSTKKNQYSDDLTFDICLPAFGCLPYSLTTLTGLPLMKAPTLATAVFISRTRASVVAHAICGVI